MTVKKELSCTNACDEERCLNCPNRKKNKKHSFVTFVVPIISLIMSFILIFEVPIVANQTLMEKKNMSLVLNNTIEVDYDSTKEKYKINVNILQGSIKKAYVADITDSGDGSFDIVYYQLNNELKDIELPLDNKKVKYVVEEDTVFENQDFIQDFIIEDIRQFAFVILDTTDQWSVWYCIVRPAITPNSSMYNFQVDYETGTASDVQPINIEEEQVVVLDGGLINLDTIQNSLGQFDTI